MSYVWREQLSRQVAELEAVQAIFSLPGEFSFDYNDLQAYEAARALLNASETTATGQPQQQQQQQRAELGGQVHLTQEGVSLRFRLPGTYPDTAPVLQVECGGSREHLQALSDAVQSGIDDAGPGMECLLTCTESLRACAQENLQEAEVGSARQTSHAEACRPPPAIMRCLIWFHHIKSLAKRKHIVTWAGELAIGGYSKPGFPGIIVAEGEQADVEEYVRRIRQLRWQAMSVRAEEHNGDVSEPDLPGPSGCEVSCSPEQQPGSLHMPRRLLPTAFMELSEKGMDELAAACQAAGIQELFLTSMKIAR